MLRTLLTIGAAAVVAAVISNRKRIANPGLSAQDMQQIYNFICELEYRKLLSGPTIGPLQIERLD